MEVNTNLEDIATRIMHWGRFNRYLTLDVSIFVLEMVDYLKGSSGIYTHLLQLKKSVLILLYM